MWRRPGRAEFNEAVGDLVLGPFAARATAAACASCRRRADAGRCASAPN
jgi:hypothetical protein